MFRRCVAMLFDDEELGCGSAASAVEALRRRRSLCFRRPLVDGGIAPATAVWKEQRRTSEHHRPRWHKF
jgi:hypothetical protein